MAEHYLRNVWYAAAISSEVGDGLLHRVILDVPVVLFRDDNGVAAALRDVCPHRFAPLSKGKRKSGGIECPYHGLVFAASGKCVLNPHGDGRILPSAKVATYPVIERHRIIWIWLGDAGLADPTTIPDFSFLDTGIARTLSVNHQVTRAHYELMTDNILDLTHADFLHPLLNSGGGTRQGAPDVKDIDPSSMRVSWTWGPSPALPFMDYVIVPGTDMHTRLAVRWHAPAAMFLSVDFATTREGLDQPDRFITPSVHIMTPETPYSTHYFFLSMRNFAVDNDELTRILEEGTRYAFGHEDRPMIEAVQANMGRETDIFAMRPLGLIGDLGGVRAREKLRKLVEAERSAA